MEKHRSQTLGESINLFNVGVATEVYGGGSAGNLFEKICLWLKPIAGRTLRFVSLESSPAELIDLTLPSTALLDYHWKKNAANDATKKLQPGFLYQPKISDLESGDAFCLLPFGHANDQNPLFFLVVLQITVGETHPVKVNGLHDIILAYSEEIRNRIRKKLLVFVTPLDGKLNSVQPLLTQQGKVIREIPPLARGFEQYVCRVGI